MTGLQVLQVLRRVRSEDSLRFPPVVVLTSSSMDSDVAEAYRLGAQSYICKPTDYHTFARAVCETLHYWLDLNHPAPIRPLGTRATSGNQFRSWRASSDSHQATTMAKRST